MRPNTATREAMASPPPTSLDVAMRIVPVIARNGSVSQRRLQRSQIGSGRGEQIGGYGASVASAVHMYVAMSLSMSYSART
jgi:hypothetical protein